MVPLFVGTGEVQQMVSLIVELGRTVHNVAQLSTTAFCNQTLCMETTTTLSQSR